VTAIIRRVAYSAADGTDLARLLADEWLVTNGLGGYAGGTVGGVLTRRYHGLLVAALPAPWGRTVMLSALWERLRFPDRSIAVLTGEERAGIAPELMAYAALYTALTDLVGSFGEESVISLVNGLGARVKKGEFTLYRSRQ